MFLFLSILNFLYASLCSCGRYICTKGIQQSACVSCTSCLHLPLFTRESFPSRLLSTPWYPITLHPVRRLFAVLVDLTDDTQYTSATPSSSMNAARHHESS